MKQVTQPGDMYNELTKVFGTKKMKQAAETFKDEKGKLNHKSFKEWLTRTYNKVSIITNI